MTLQYVVHIVHPVNGMRQYPYVSCSLPRHGGCASLHPNLQNFTKPLFANYFAPNFSIQQIITTFVVTRPHTRLMGKHF